VRAAPTARMVAYAEKLAKTKKLPLPPGYAQDFQACCRFLDQYGRRQRPASAAGPN